jgi:phosphoribosylaminoimidazole-succinocarboxamide synthase
VTDNILLETNFSDLKLFKKGKVRDVYDLGEHYLIVSTDRLSAFDVIMAQGIPYKGIVLNKISEFWFNFTGELIENHLITTDVREFPGECAKYAPLLEGRSMLVKKAELIPLECIVRGYISGSGWKDYKRTGSISGITLKEGLSESEILDDPIFTPSTKAEIGDHDENIDESSAKKLIGESAYETIKKIALSIYSKAAEFAAGKGILIADTKMEFGSFNDGIILIDELLTPDSSRFWPRDKYSKGKAQESYDKQYVRDYLESINFNKQPPPPVLPDNVVENTSKKYREVLKQLTGIEI